MSAKSELEYCVYTDGSSIHNGKKNCRSGYGIYFGENDPRNISIANVGKQSNNVAELSAIITAIKIIVPDVLTGHKITIYTDSKYAILCLTSYGEKCNKKHWELEIPNKELVREAYELYQMYNQNICVKYIKAHTGNKDAHSLGNEKADILAKLALK
jgi:ribonuclease HI